MAFQLEVGCLGYSLSPQLSGGVVSSFSGCQVLQIRNLMSISSFHFINNLLFLSRRLQDFLLIFGVQGFYEVKPKSFPINTTLQAANSSLSSANICLVSAFPLSLPFSISGMPIIHLSVLLGLCSKLLFSFTVFTIYIFVLLCDISSTWSSRPLTQIPTVACLFFNPTDKLNILVQKSCFLFHIIFGMGVTIESPRVFLLFFCCCLSPLAL